MNTSAPIILYPTCPTPTHAYDQVILGHGSGGKLSADLLRDVFLPAFENKTLSRLEDQASLPLPKSGRLALTTDSFVVQPIFFPGGDIGKLAVCGTVNDLAMGGARPLYLAAAFILEEGLAIRDLERIVHSMRITCQEAGIELVTGDTKVVNRGKGDQIFITTTGVGLIPDGRVLSAANARPGDRILISGTIGDHGIAILSHRDGIEFETELKSDCALLHSLSEALLYSCPGIRSMRDPTRGGVASVMHELAAASHVGIKLIESNLPIRAEVRSACELLGLDPLYVANEGKLIAIVPPLEADAALAAAWAHPLGRNARLIGEVVAIHPGQVTLRSAIGGERKVTVLAGEQLPRIC